MDAASTRRCRRGIRSTTRCRSRRTRIASGMVFAGTGHGFFYSRDDGKTWTQFKDKLPAAPVNWIEVPKNAPEVAVATYGRGLWILRDVWQLEQGDSPRRSRRSCSCYKPRARRSGARRGGTARRSCSRWRRRRPRRSRWRCSARTARCISTSQVQGARRAEPDVVEPAVSRRPISRCCDRFRRTIRTSGTRAAGRGASGRSRTGASARSAGSRARRRASTRVRMTLQRPAVHAAVRGLARRDAAVDRRGPRRPARTLQRNIVDAMNEVVDKINRIEIMRDAGRGPAQGARGEQDARQRRWPASTSGCTTPSCTTCRARRCTATTSGTSRSTSST